MTRIRLSSTDTAAPQSMGQEDAAIADLPWLRAVDDVRQPAFIRTEFLFLNTFISRAVVKSHVSAQAIAGEERKISALQEHVDEIDETLTELANLHEKIKYEIMVPYGRVAMFPGAL